MCMVSMRVVCVRVCVVCVRVCGVCVCGVYVPHAASSGFLASPNPIAAIPFARASGKGLLYRTTIFFPANFVTLLAVI